MYFLFTDKQDQRTEFQAVQLNQNEVPSDYAEICEIDTTCSHTPGETETNQVQQANTMTHLKLLAKNKGICVRVENRPRLKPLQSSKTGHKYLK